MIKGDYHTHTRASDGRNSVRRNIAEAKAAGLCQLAITDHSFSNILCHMSVAKFDRQEKEIAEYGKDSGIKIFHGVEANLNARGGLDVPDGVIRRLDVLNVGFHRLLRIKAWKGSMLFLHGNGWLPERIRGKLVDMNTAAFAEAIAAYPVDTICHLNHRALVDTKKICEIAAEHGVYIELNEKHIKTMERDIDAALETGVNFILGSDAHRRNEVGRFPKVEDFIKRHGIPEERIFGMGGNLPVFKDKTGWTNPDPAKSF